MASTTLTFDATQAQRISVALGKVLGLTDANGNPRGCTVAEYHDWLVGVTKRMVVGQEYQDSLQAVAAPPDVPIT